MAKNTEFCIWMGRFWQGSDFKRGDPLCYINFELDNPEKIPKLVRAKLTKELKDFRKGMHAVPDLFQILLV